MRRIGVIAGLAVCLAGCAPTVPERVYLYSDDGVYLFQRGDYTGARESFELALQLQPQDATLLFNLGQCYDRQGNAAKAEECYKQCLERSANHADCRHALAVLWVLNGRRADAERLVADWLAREPKLSAAWAEHGWLLRQDGELPQAQASLQKALELDAKNLRALNELAVLFEVLELPERALVLYERSLEQNPRQPDIAERIDLLKTKGVRKPRPD
jgi:Flp pilus assembly protein TadD